ncbi:VOC family protein [Pseudonocardia sp. NPDC049635]|uniref:VOC family protein n=1 Tax=Pseudonocardia sp. NPDC049635 TaxID=3155506 RepID=UPI0033DC1200
MRLQHRRSPGRCPARGQRRGRDGTTLEHRSDRRTAMICPVVRFELSAAEPERARHFYRAAFGWHTVAVPDTGYTQLLTAGPDAPGAINGGLVHDAAPNAAPVIVVQVTDVAATLYDVEHVGGRRVTGPVPIGDHGHSAAVTDTEGNTIGLWQPTR